MGHINKYTEYFIGEVYDDNGYGGMAYYSSETCGYVNGTYISSGCTNDYTKSDVKFLVDAWAESTFKSEELVIDSMGYSARLITVQDLLNIGYYYDDNNSLRWENVPEWIHDYTYATMISGYDDNYIKYIDVTGFLNPIDVCSFDNIYRPVVNLKKSAIEKEEIIDDDINKSDTDAEQDDENVTNNETKEKVNVPNTFEKVSIVFILIGIVLVSISTIILIKNRSIIKK